MMVKNVLVFFKSQMNDGKEKLYRFLLCQFNSRFVYKIGLRIVLLYEC